MRIHVEGKRSFTGKEEVEWDPVGNSRKSRPAQSTQRTSFRGGSLSTSRRSHRRSPPHPLERVPLVGIIGLLPSCGAVNTSTCSYGHLTRLEHAQRTMQIDSIPAIPCASFISYTSYSACLSHRGISMQISLHLRHWYTFSSPASLVTARPVAPPPLASSCDEVRTRRALLKPPVPSQAYVPLA